MLAAAAARLRERRDLVWVDMGGGTGVSVMARTYCCSCQRVVRPEQRTPFKPGISSIYAVNHHAYAFLTCLRFLRARSISLLGNAVTKYSN